MGFQSIFAWKALPEAAFVKKAVIDAHRSKHESVASGWLHRSARPILPQASPVWKVWNLQIVSFEHAKASAALAASCKRSTRRLSFRPSDALTVTDRFVAKSRLGGTDPLDALSVLLLPCRSAVVPSTTNKLATVEVTFVIFSR